jgi:hypothetical protein
MSETGIFPIFDSGAGYGIIVGLGKIANFTIYSLANLLFQVVSLPSS